MRTGFVSVSENKAVNSIIKRIRNLIQGKQNSYGNDSIYIDIEELKSFDKDIMRICEFIYARCLKDEDVNNIRKEISKALKNYNMNYKNFYTSKFILSNVLLTSSISETLLNISQDEMISLSIIYRTMCIVEIILCKTSKRIITGVDIENNKLKYVSTGNLLFDNINDKYITEETMRVYIKEFEKMCFSLTTKFPELDMTEIMMRANDKIDEVISSFYQTRIMLDILGVQGIVNFDKRMECLNSLVCSKVTRNDWNNKKIVCENPVSLVYKDGVRIIKVQDFNINNNYPCIVISYVDRKGREDTHVVPINMDIAVYTEDIDVVEKIVKFYCKETNVDNKVGIYGEDIWKDRFSSSIEKKVREYKKQVVPIYMHKAKMGNPSEEALALAKKWNITLEPGETLVKSHLRRYGN